MSRRRKNKAIYWLKYFIRSIRAHKLLLILSLLILAAGLNWVVQAISKPAEVIGLADRWFFKTPQATWETYGHLFKKHSTPICTAPFLAALAQSESSGNPIARTLWVWRWQANPFRWYAPATTATGLYQITDGTFEQTRTYCIHRGKVVRQGDWYDVNSCWYTSYYNRLWPSHAIEMTSAFLHDTTTKLLERRRVRNFSISQKQNIAALIHLCGQGAADRFIRRGGVLSASDRCGAHSARGYLRKFQNYREVFKKLSRYDDN